MPFIISPNRHACTSPSSMPVAGMSKDRDVEGQHQITKIVPIDIPRGRFVEPYRRVTRAEDGGRSEDIVDAECLRTEDRHLDNAEPG